MLRAFNAAARPRSSRRLARRALAVVTMGVAIVAAPSTAQAAEIESGSVVVDGLPLAIQLTCTVTCSTAVAAASSGSISGVDGTAPFTVSWTDPPLGSTNLSGSISYSSACFQSAVWTGAAVGSSTVTIQGAQLTYDATPGIGASVTLYFSGAIEPGFFVPVTAEVLITGGSHTIDIQFPDNPGSMPMAPTSTPTLCAGTQTFTASGDFLTFGA